MRALGECVETSRPRVRGQGLNLDALPLSTREFLRSCIKARAEKIINLLRARRRYAIAQPSPGELLIAGPIAIVVPNEFPRIAVCVV